MKRLIFTGLFLCCAFVSVLAQEQVRIFKNGSSTRFTTSELTFLQDGTAIQVGDSVYAPMEIDSILVVHTVTVTFAGDTALVDLGHAPEVTATTNTQHELEFVLQGESSHGSLTYEGPLKCKFYLNGLNLHSTKGAAINIQCGKRINLILNPGTENVISDAAGGEQKAAFYCKGHLEVEGSGSLTVTGRSKHGIAGEALRTRRRRTASGAGDA